MEFAATYFAVLRAGLVAMPVNTSYVSAEIDFQLESSAARLVVTDVGLADRVAGAPDVVVTDSREWDELHSVEPFSGDARAGDEDLAVLLYTSGTTGQPRGAMLSHRALLANLDQLAGIDPPVVASDDVVLLVLPLFHVYGLNAGLGMTAFAGATGVLSERFDPVDTLALVRDARVTNIIGAPPMYVAWSMLPDLRQSLTSVRLLVSGAAPLPAAVLSHVVETTGSQVYEGYGLTETAPVLTTTLCSASPKPGSIGRPIPGVSTKILNHAEDEVDEHDPGELVVNGDNLFSGYWPNGEGGPDSDGWF